MDSGTIIIGGISIICCVLPFAVIRRNRKSLEKKYLQALEHLASRHNCQITQYEFCGEAVIGLDSANKFVFFYRKTKDGETAQQVNLLGIQKCRVIKTSRTINSKEGAYPAIDRLELSFEPGAKNEPGGLLEIFNAGESMHLVGELQLAEKWENSINAVLGNKTV